MFMAPIEPPRSSHGHRIVRLLRRWAAVDRAEPRLLSDFVAFAETIGVQPITAVAIASMFQLTEACLGRPLVPECCCSPRLSRDERAVLLMLATAPAALPHQASAAVPHGLPGALAWAVHSVRRMTNEHSASPAVKLMRCPFDQELVALNSGE